MPRLSEDLGHAVAFLYKSKEDAEKNAKSGGSCFVVARPVEGARDDDGGTIFLLYAVTNFHVTWTADCPVMRLHRRDGKRHIVELTKSDWVPHPGDDLAASFLSYKLADDAVQNIRYVSTDTFLKEEEVEPYSIGPGDDVFMFGRFLNHQGTKDSIIAALRFGNVSVGVGPIGNSAINADQASFAVEMRSRTGFSGSPVAVYRNFFNNPFGVTAPEQNFWRLLGVNWGYIVEKDTGENTWLNGVVPAWKIVELLNVPTLQDQHDAASEIIRKHVKSGVGPAVATDLSPLPLTT